MADVPEDLIRPSKAAKILACHQATVYRLIMRGTLRAWRLGKDHYRVSEADVRALLQPVQPDAQPYELSSDSRRAAAHDHPAL